MTDTNKSVVKMSGALSIDKTSQSAYAVRIVGATMNNDLKGLLKILKDTEKTNDTIAYCALSGIFAVITTKDKNKEDEDDYEDYEFEEKVKDDLSSWVESFEKVLVKNDYHDYPIAMMPEANISKEKFWDDVWKKVFSIAFSAAYTRAGQKGELYALTNVVNKVLLIASQHELCNKEKFLKESVKNIALKQLDDEYISSFSNSVNKIWDAGRAFWEYFLRKMILFNPSIPTSVGKAVEKRWQAWFLLEDKYKREQKPVKRDLLLKEVTELSKLL